MDSWVARLRVLSNCVSALGLDGYFTLLLRLRYRATWLTATPFPGD